MKCRINKKKCKIFLNFGEMPLANGFLKKKDIKKEYFFNMSVSFNKSLSLFQLVKNPNPKKMFNKKYPFYTSSSKFMIEHFKKFSVWAKKNYLKKKGYRILEIGSNDGTFLKNFKKDNCLGFEPSKSVHKIAKQNGIKSINKFFNLNNIKKLKKNIQFDMIVGSNVFCHIPDQVDLIKSINKLLSMNGTLVFEEPYLGSMFKKVSYDQIYDEHIFMFSVSSIKKIYELFNFKLVDAIPQKTHGGSMRYIIQRNYGQKISKRLLKLLNYEKQHFIDKIKGCLIFKKKVEESKKNLIKKIKKIKMKKEKIFGYGATSKSTTILNYCNINNKMIDCIFDTTKDKIGKLTPGTHIPVIDYKYFKNKKCKNIFLFAWNHKKEIFQKEKASKNIKWFSHIS